MVDVLDSDVIGEIEERADHVSAEELVELTADSEFFRKIRAKLIGRGAKLLSGPRGTGKTHQMRYVYLECVRSRRRPAAIYVSFSRYARLEPLLGTAVDARKIFGSWVMAKLLVGLASFGSECKCDFETLIFKEIGFSSQQLEDYVAEVENGDRPLWHETVRLHVNIARVQSLFRDAIAACGRSRMILLLDDAALSLAPEYLVEFFNVFQDLKSPLVSPKASVYPGTTQYGPRFHVRHDAETINAWLSVEDSGYAEVFTQLLSKRPSLTADVPPDVAELLMYLSFGVPRVLLTMLRSYRHSAAMKNSNPQQGIKSVVEEQVQLLEAEYQSLSYKLPQFKSVIAAGLRLFERMAEDVVIENRRLHPHSEKQTVIGVQREVRPPAHDRMIRFLVEVGLLYPLKPVQHGEDREYDRYVLHYARLMQSRAFSTGRGFSARDAVAYIQRKSAKHPLRRGFGSLLNSADVEVKLDLASCERCHAARMVEAQRFCHQCGAQLPEPSRYRQCLQLPIERLPIPEWYKENIKKSTGLKVIGDLLALQDPASELRKASLIGKKRSVMILEAVRREVEDFLS